MPVTAGRLRLTLLITLIAFASPFTDVARAQRPLVLGDSGVPIGADKGSIDVDATVRQLAAMHCNTYLYDVVHGTDAWAKLPAFCKAAAEHDIDVWVYLWPWSLAERGNQTRDNEPFGLDFTRWSLEVAVLMEAHPNLRGIAMDDFASNTHHHDRFTPAYVGRMLTLGRAMNPRFAFKPVLYFTDPWDELMDRFAAAGTFRDGVIVCYPRSEREVDHALDYLQDRARGAALSVQLPKRRKLDAGQGTFATARLGESARDAAELRFFLSDQNVTDKRGRHRLIVRVDDEEVWRREVADGSIDRNVKVPLDRPRADSTIEIGVLVDEEPDEQTIVRVRFGDVTLVDRQGRTLRRQPKWAGAENDGIRFDVTQAASGEGRWRIPMTLMLAGAPFQHEKRYDEPGDADRIGAKLKDALAWSKAGKADGVILWWTPKDDQSPLPRVVARAFAEAGGRRD